MNVWLLSSLLLLGVWVVLFLVKKSARKEMLWTSLFTLFLGFTEPLFVPEYWLPESLFDLAARTGFDLESFIFSFALGGIVVVLYELVVNVTHEKIPAKEIYAKRLILHRVLLFVPVIVFAGVYLLTTLNPIYAVILSLASGGISTLICRPDLWRKVVLGSLLFFGFYFLFFAVVVVFFPTFVEETWNLPVLWGIFVLGVPLEELLFAFTLGLMWSAIYEHWRWIRLR